MTLLKRPLVKAIVSVDGKNVNYKSIKICQEMSQHHDFELLLDHETIDPHFYDELQKKLCLSYAKVAIDLQHGDDNGKAYCFSGVITNVRMQALNGMHGGLLLLGKSSSIELDRGLMSQSYSLTNLQTILNEITKGTMFLSTNISPDWKSDIDFELQYCLSDWGFLQKLCNKYRERYYYSGTELIVGSHREFNVAKLTYDMELRSLEMCSRLLPNKYSEYYYQRETHTTLRQDSPADIEGATNTLQQISGYADYLNHTRKPNVPVSGYVPDMGSLIELSKRRKVATGGQMMYVRGTAITSDVRIGRLVSISMPKNMGGTDMGLYRVYKVVHLLDETGHYECHFEGLPADLKYIPTPEVQAPMPFPIEVEIWSNDSDSDGMGRVKVQFPFDNRPCDALIPVMSLDAGGAAKGSGNVTVNRGVTWLPEKGDSCLLSFLDGQQLSQPFIMGSMFHGKITDKQGGGKNNYIKTLITKSGHTIKFDDTNDKELIQIYDKKDNIVEINTKEDAISIYANSTINLTAVDVNITAKRSFNVTAGLAINAQSGKTSTFSTGGTTLMTSAKDTQFTAGKALTAKGGKNVDIASGASAHMKLNSKGNVDVQAKKKVKVLSKKEVEINGKSKATIASRKTFVEGNSQIALKGKKIKNN